MNYRHIYHAGNFADVLKHAVFIAILAHLKAKDAAFRVLDTHAGLGVYDLSSEQAQKTGEWRDGIGQLMAATLPPEVRPLLAPYLDLVRSLNQPDGAATDGLSVYPGSPEIARRLMRRQDRLTLTELHPQDHAAVAARYAGDHQVRVVELDAWLAMGSFVPFKERRGVVLIDPAFEAADEYRTLAAALFKAHRRWSTGIYAAWYPAKDAKALARFYRMMADTGIRKILRMELRVARPVADGPLSACGLLVINPPWTLEAQLRPVLPWLAKTLAQGPDAGFTLDWLAPE